jgi:tRNA pseudouridine38-40 synthase
MVGVLIECGRGNLSEAEIKKFLIDYSDIPAKLTVPPSGLFLNKVYYSPPDLTEIPEWPLIISDNF